MENFPLQHVVWLHFAIFRNVAATISVLLFVDGIFVVLFKAILIFIEIMRKTLVLTSQRTQPVFVIKLVV
jgi:hypothetical protein